MWFLLNIFLYRALPVPAFRIAIKLILLNFHFYEKFLYEKFLFENDKTLWKNVTNRPAGLGDHWIRKVSRNRKTTKSYVDVRKWLTGGTEWSFRCLDGYFSHWFSARTIKLKLYSPGETSACRFKVSVKVSKYAQIEGLFYRARLSTFNQINVDPWEGCCL